MIVIKNNDHIQSEIIIFCFHENQIFAESSHTYTHAHTHMANKIILMQTKEG